MRLPDGRNASREYLIYPNTVVMIPLSGDGTVLMECQFHYPVNRMMIEFPIGKLGPQEGALVCGKCKLCEGTSYTAERWDYLTCIHPVISYPTGFIDIYLVRNFKQGEAVLDEGESPETLITSAGQLID